MQSPFSYLQVLELCPGLGVAVRTVDGTAFTGLEGNLGVLAAGGTDGIVHFARGLGSVFPGSAAIFAAFWFVGKAFFMGWRRI